MLGPDHLSVLVRGRSICPFPRRSNILYNRDDMHLGPAAMKMIGVGIAADLSEGRGPTWVADEGEDLFDNESRLTAKFTFN